MPSNDVSQPSAIENYCQALNQLHDDCKRWQQHFQEATEIQKRTDYLILWKDTHYLFSEFLKELQITLTDDPNDQLQAIFDSFSHHFSHVTKALEDVHSQLEPALYDASSSSVIAIYRDSLNALHNDCKRCQQHYLEAVPDRRWECLVQWKQAYRMFEKYLKGIQDILKKKPDEALQGLFTSYNKRLEHINEELEIASARHRPPEPFAVDTVSFEWNCFPAWPLNFFSCCLTKPLSDEIPLLSPTEPATRYGSTKS